MIEKKNNTGFSLIEVLIALAIAAMTLTPLFISQMQVLYSTNRSSHLNTRLFYAKKFLHDSHRKTEPYGQELTLEKKVLKPDTQLVYRIDTVPENSAIKKFKHINHETVSLTWRDRNKKEQASLGRFLFNPQEPRA